MKDLLLPQLLHKHLLDGAQNVRRYRICHVSIKQFERAFGGITVLTQALPAYSEDIFLT